MSETTPAAAPAPAVEETKAEDTTISAPINDAAEAAESEKAANLVQNKVRLGVSGGEWGWADFWGMEAGCSHKFGIPPPKVVRVVVLERYQAFVW